MTPFPDSNKRLNLAVALNSAAMLLFFSWLSFYRNVDGDEGLYLEAARLVAEGKSLYFDFFYQQMPLIPYLYAGWMKIFGFGFFQGRFLCALLTALAGTAYLYYVARKTRSFWKVQGMAVLFYANGLILAWASVVKTHPLNVFALTVSCVLLVEWRNRGGKPIWLLALAGFVIGMGVCGRLTLAPFPVFFLAFVFVFSQGRRWADCAVFTFFVVLATIPALYFFFRDPSLFLQYNLTYHQEVFPRVADAARRSQIARSTFLQPQTFLLVVLAQLGVLMTATRGGRKFLKSDEAFFAFVSAVFIAVHMAAAEPFTQYFSAIVPCLLLSGLPILDLGTTVLRKAALATALLYYLFTARPLFEFEIRSMGSADYVWRVSNVVAAAKRAESLIRPGEPCITWWPGYAFMANCRSPKGMENHMRIFAINVGTPREQLREYGMLPDQDLYDLLASGEVRVVLDGAYHLPGPLGDSVRKLIRRKYRLVDQVGGVRIYLARSPRVPKAVNGEGFERSPR